MLKESHRFGIQVPYCPFDPLSHAPAASSLGSVGAVNKLSPTAIVHPSVLGPPGTSRFATTTARFLFNATQLTHPALTLTGDAVVVGLGVGHESFWVVEDGYGFAFAFAICEGLVDGTRQRQSDKQLLMRLCRLPHCPCSVVPRMKQEEERVHTRQGRARGDHRRSSRFPRWSPP